MKFTVHHYLPVIVSVKDVEAESMEEAVENSMGEAMAFGEEHLTADARHCGNVKSSQFADGHLGALVDANDDPEYLRTTYIGSEEARAFLPEEHVDDQ